MTLWLPVALILIVLAGCAPGTHTASAESCDKLWLPNWARFAGVPTAEELPAEWAPFAGVWSGAWDSNRCMRFALMNVLPDGDGEFVVAWSEASAPSKRTGSNRSVLSLLSDRAFGQSYPTTVKLRRGTVHTKMHYRYTLHDGERLRAQLAWDTGLKIFGSFRKVQPHKAPTDGTMTRDRYQPIGGRVGE